MREVGAGCAAWLFSISIFACGDFRRSGDHARFAGQW
jgi:hypothetical protein